MSPQVLKAMNLSSILDSFIARELHCCRTPSVPIGLNQLRLKTLDYGGDSTWSGQVQPRLCHHINFYVLEEKHILHIKPIEWSISLVAGAKITQIQFYLAIGDRISRSPRPYL